MSDFFRYVTSIVNFDFKLLSLLVTLMQINSKAFNAYASTLTASVSAQSFRRK